MDKTKIQKQYPDFALEVERLTPEQLRARIVELQKGLQESEEHKEANEELTALQAQVGEMLAPYRDVRKAVKAKTAYILELLKEQGQ